MPRELDLRMKRTSRSNACTRSGTVWILRYLL